MEARLVEIFSSTQGEGLRLGERQTFVRFQACDLKCRWCDTPESFARRPEFKVEVESFSNRWEVFPNPISQTNLTQWLKHFSDPYVSLTGGEPLQQVDFLERWLPTVFSSHRFLLETNGVLPEAFKRIQSWIHTVSMDIKLPSSAKTGVWWKEHQAFLKLLPESPESYVKIVLTEETKGEELKQALNLVKESCPEEVVILQPVSETKNFHDLISRTHLVDLLHLASTLHKHLRVIPQVHKLMGVL